MIDDGNNKSNAMTMEVQRGRWPLTAMSTMLIESPGVSLAIDGNVNVESSGVSLAIDGDVNDASPADAGRR